MKTKHFLAQVDHDRLHRVIQAAENGTSARIVVYITHQGITDPLTKAHAVFRKMKLETEAERTGFLLFLAPKTQKFAVLGGTALHEKFGQSWWDGITRVVTSHFKEGNFTEGLLAAIQMAGLEFQQHFPSKRAHLPTENDIVED